MLDAAAPAFLDPFDLAKLMDVTLNSDPAQTRFERITGTRIGIRDIPVCALINPRAQDADLIRGERRGFAWRRHLAVFDQARDVMN